MTTYARRFATLLDEKGVVLKGISRACGVSNSTIWNWRKGHSKPRDIIGLAGLFGVTPARLRGYLENDSPTFYELLRKDSDSTEAEPAPIPKIPKTCANDNLKPDSKEIAEEAKFQRTPQESLINAGMRISEALKKKSFSLEMLSLLSGISQDRLVSYKDGIEDSLSKEEFLRICILLSVEPNWVVFGEELFLVKCYRGSTPEGRKVAVSLLEMKAFRLGELKKSICNIENLFVFNH